MSLPAFADVVDLDARIPGGIRDTDTERAQAALDDASALIRAETGQDLWSDFPDIVFQVTISAARRSFENPSGLTQETTGPFSASFANASPDVYLTAREKRLVRQAAGLGGLSTLSTTRGPLETEPVCDPYGSTQYLPVDPPGQDMPWAGPDGY